MEAENSVHPNDVWDDEVGQHDVKADVPELLIVAGQVGVQTAVNIPQVLNRLQGHLQKSGEKWWTVQINRFNTINSYIH